MKIAVTVAGVVISDSTPPSAAASFLLFYVLSDECDCFAERRELFCMRMTSVTARMTAVYWGSARLHQPVYTPYSPTNNQYE